MIPSEKPITVPTYSTSQPTPAETIQSNPPSPVKVAPKLEKAYAYACKGKYQQALEAIPVDSREEELRNNRAVCLIRMHQFEWAIPILKELVISSHISMTRDNVPEYIKANYAVALFYGGLPGGANDMMTELSDSKLPAVGQLRSLMAQWTKSLGFWKRLDWKINGIAPKQRPLPPDLPLGQFSWESVT
jgi:hypothetical protein